MIRQGRIVANESLATLRRRAGHRVTIRWADAAAVTPPPFLTLDSQGGAVWTGMLSGPVEPLVRWLAERSIEDLAIGPPDLETLFRGFYDSTKESP